MYSSIWCSTIVQYSIRVSHKGGACRAWAGGLATCTRCLPAWELAEAAESHVTLRGEELQRLVEGAENETLRAGYEAEQQEINTTGVHSAVRNTAAIRAINNHYLRQAARDGNEGVLRELLVEGFELDGVGFDADAGDELNRTALMEACWKGHLSCASLLVDRYAGIDHQDDFGDTPLVYACDGGHDACVRLLLDVMRPYPTTQPLLFCINHTNNQGKSALVFACEGGYDACVRLLAEAGAELNSFPTFPDGLSGEHTPLMIACESDEACTRVLIEVGAQVNKVNRWGYSALHLTCERGDEVRAHLLIEAGAELEEVEKRSTSMVKRP